MFRMDWLRCPNTYTRLYILYKIFRNLVSTVARHECRDCNSKVWKQFEDVYRIYKTFIINVRLVKNY